MGRPYSEDLRRRIVAAIEGGLSRNVAAARFGVSVSCAVKLMQHFRRTGTVAPAARVRKPFALAGHEDLVREIVANGPDLTLDELTEELARRGVQTSRSGVNRFLNALGFTLKKVRPGRRAGPSGCCGRARGLAISPTILELCAAGLHR